MSPTVKTQSRQFTSARLRPIQSNLPRSRRAWYRRRLAIRRRSCLRWWWQWRRPWSNLRSGWWLWCMGWPEGKDTRLVHHRPFQFTTKKNEEKKIQLKFWNIPQRPRVKKLRSCSSPSVGSSRLALRPCLELLWTNMLSETASRGPSTFTCEDTITYNNKIYGLEASAKTRPFHQPLSTELTCCRIKSSKNSVRRMRKFRRLVTLAPDDPLYLWGRHTSGQQVTSPSHSERRRL